MVIHLLFADFLSKEWTDNRVQLKTELEIRLDRTLDFRLNKHYRAV